MQVFVEDWSARYGSPYLVDPGEAAAPGRAELVEDGGELRAHRGGPAPVPRLAFVDGVRRVEATLYLADADELALGIAGSHACGAVVAEGEARLTFAGVQVTRMAILGSGARAALPSSGGFAWQSASVADASPDAPLNELQSRMRQQEGIVAEELGADGRLVVVDGPLHFVRSRDLPVVGYVKSHHRVLLDPASHQRVPTLAAAERTSLFRLGTDRYSSYARIATPARDAGPWSGIVRLEIPQSAGLAEAIRTADAATATLPRYAGVSWRDPRAPQNLQPVGALESHLRHRLGDARLAARAVRAAVAAIRGREDAA